MDYFGTARRGLAAGRGGGLVEGAAHAEARYCLASAVVAGARLTLQCLGNEMIARPQAALVTGAKAAFQFGNDTGRSFLRLVRVNMSWIDETSALPKQRLNRQQSGRHGVAFSFRRVEKQPAKAQLAQLDD